MKKAHSIILSEWYTFVCFQRYDLKCITYWDRGCYTCAMKLQNPNAPVSGWYLYDGLQVKNGGICPTGCSDHPTIPQGCLLPHAIYILDSPWALNVNAPVSLNNYAKTHWRYHTCSDCCEKDTMRYPGSKGILVVGINNYYYLVLVSYCSH